MLTGGQFHGKHYGKIDNVKACSFFTFVEFRSQLFQSHKCFTDVFEIHSPFIVTHNKCIINVMACIFFSDKFYLVVPKHFFLFCSYAPRI